MQEKAPAFQFYPKDWLCSANVMALTAEEEAWYLRALCVCWLEGSIPSDPELLSRIIGKGCSEGGATTVQRCFIQHPNDATKLIHKRLNKEAEKQAEWRLKSQEGGKKSAQSRAYRGKGGSTNVQPKANSSSSSSSSSSYINTRGVSELNFPESVPEKLQNAIRSWAAYKSAKFQKEFGQVECDALLIQYDGQWDMLKSSIFASISNGWRNVTPQARPEAPTQSNGTNGKTHVDLQARPALKEFVPPPREPPPTPEARERIREMVARVVKS